MSVEAYKKLHTLNPGYGKTGERLLDYVEPFLSDLKAKRILDFGCGKGALGKRLRTLGYDVTLYDPYVEDYSSPPDGQFDLVLCTDVMEHIHKADLNSVLEYLATLSDHVLFVISLTFADALLPDGSNAHCTIESADWWLEEVRRHFPSARTVQTRQATAVGVITWQAQPATLARLSTVHNRRERREKMKARLLLPVKAVAARLIGVRRLAPLKELVEGNTVAIVGNASSICARTYGAEIDAHDVVIRLNRGPIISPDTNGTRTTVLASSIWVSRGNFRQKKCKLLLWLTPKRREFPLWLVKSRHMGAVFPKRLYQDLSERLGSRPSSGMMVTSATLLCNPSSVSLFGFDGFQSDSLSGIGQRHVGPHDYPAEQAYLSKLAQQAALEIRP